MIKAILFFTQTGKSKRLVMLSACFGYTDTNFSCIYPRKGWQRVDPFAKLLLRPGLR